jgi:hypothetical protein
MLGSQFSAIFADLVRKMAFFFKTNVAIQNFQKLAAI